MAKATKQHKPRKRQSKLKTAQLSSRMSAPPRIYRAPTGGVLTISRGLDLDAAIKKRDVLVPAGQ
jgi:hypothetical protein